eukprot:GILJ01034719.1.p1 GENE.GILJ01034719.1~~GILJ01034719.1.p1  ORF type:complete len:101 (+),score=4.46 GILJ01034719.1:22-324(+)
MPFNQIRGHDDAKMEPPPFPSVACEPNVVRNTSVSQTVHHSVDTIFSDAIASSITAPFDATLCFDGRCIAVSSNKRHQRLRILPSCRCPLIGRKARPHCS